MMTLIRKHAVFTIFVIAVFGCLGMAIQQLVYRVPYNWDLFMWSESPFLTNMLKIDAGQAVFSSPEEVNSFVYSPGLEYVTYALLKPFGRQLDIRYCRVVSIGFVVLAALAFMRCSILLGREGIIGTRSRWFAPLSAALFFLVIYHNCTSDVTHPDNMHICHLAVTLMLTFEAIRRPSAWRAIAAVLFASLAVLVKQTAAFSVIGVAISLSAFAPRKLRTALWLIPLGAASSMAVLAFLWSMGEARFYTFDVLSSHGITKEKIPILLSLFFQQYRLILVVLLVIALSCGFRSRNRTLKQFLLAYLLVGIAEAIPALIGFLKPMGYSNNLGVVEVWAAVPFVPFLLSLLKYDPIKQEGEGGSNSVDGFARLTAAAIAFSLVFCYIPLKDAPRQSHYDYCRQVESLIGADLKAGKHVLVPHGTSFLIRNDSRQVPLDRSNSVLELYIAGKNDMMGTAQRLYDKYYDKIYLNTAWYPPELVAIIQENYQEVGRIPCPVDRVSSSVLSPDFLKYGFQPLHFEVPIFERREAPPSIVIDDRPSTRLR